MADNVAITPGTGATVAADDIGGVLHQRVKIGLGADGTAVDAVAGAGVVGTGVQRVTLANDDVLVAKLPAVLAAGGGLKVEGVAGGIAVPVSGTFYQATQPVSGTFWQATQPISGSVSITGSAAVTGTFWQATQPISIAATVAISAAALPLPSGAATETTLAALNTKQPSQGQAAMAASVPVVLASNQSALGVTGTFWQATQPVSGTITANAGSGTMAVSGTFWQATQPVSGTVTANAGSGTQAVSLAALPALVAGAALVGKVGIDQTTPGTTNAMSLAQVGATTVATGNGVVSAGVQRVAIASDNTAFSVNAVQSGTWNIGSVTTLPALVAGSALIGKVGIDQTTPGTTNAVAVISGQAGVAGGAGAVGATVQRATLASDDPAVTALQVMDDWDESDRAKVNLVAGQAGVDGGSGAVTAKTQRVTQAGLEYETVAASQTDQVLGATGATGDFISHLIIQPTTTAAGTVTLKDNTTVIFTFTTGTLGDLKPITVPLNLISVSGAWKVTTGANVAVIGIGDFT